MGGTGGTGAGATGGVVAEDVGAVEAVEAGAAGAGAANSSRAGVVVFEAVFDEGPAEEFLPPPPPPAAAAARRRRRRPHRHRPARPAQNFDRQRLLLVHHAVVDEKLSHRETELVPRLPRPRRREPVLNEYS